MPPGTEPPPTDDRAGQQAGNGTEIRRDVKRELSPWSARRALTLGLTAGNASSAPAKRRSRSPSMTAFEDVKASNGSTTRSQGRARSRSRERSAAFSQAASNVARNRSRDDDTSSHSRWGLGPKEPQPPYRRQRERSLESRRESRREQSRDTNKGRSRDNRNHSRERHRESSKDKVRDGSRLRDRERVREEKRHRSRDRHRHRSEDRRRDRSRDRHGGEHREGSTDRHSDRPKDRHRDRSGDRHRERSRNRERTSHKRGGRSRERRDRSPYGKRKEPSSRSRSPIPYRHKRRASSSASPPRHRRRSSRSPISPSKRRKHSPSASPPPRSRKPLPDQEVSFRGLDSSTQAPTKYGGAPPDREKPNFKPTGLLAKEANKVEGTKISLKYHEPPEARKPPASARWVLMIFKGPDVVDNIELSSQSCWLLGRAAQVADIHLEHPSCSQQHAAIQFRWITKTVEDESGVRKQTGKVKPYLIDLESSNGTMLNDEDLEHGRYIELRDKDIIKFGGSDREYMIMRPPRE